jgi:hypothetical protein
MDHVLWALMLRKPNAIFKFITIYDILCLY